MTKLVCQEDPSINWVEEALFGFLESRYVRKVPEYFIVYLSSQSGCNKGCRMCHLTATKQTKFEDVREIDYLAQASKGLKHYSTQEKAKYCHFNFMARGEALANSFLLKGADSILYELGKLAHTYDPDLGIRFNISTILPKGTPSLESIFKTVHPTIYYSLYSANPEFRKEWLPQALPLEEALAMLKSYQIFSKKLVKIHHCFIENKNDSIEDIDKWMTMLEDHQLDYEFNLVRYNPYSEKQGKESSDEVIERNIKYISDRNPGATKIIPRVGFTVKASCGMFVEKE